VANASNDDFYIGVAQSVIATGDPGMVLVRGKGKIRLAAGCVTASGDRLYASTNFGDAGTSMGQYTAFDVASADKVAIALQSSTAAAATIDAYIVIV
jgi:hypothetical protein